MAFSGGPINTVGIVPSYSSNLGQQTSSSGIVQAQNQVWQGVGQSFVGKPGQPLTGSLTGSPVNVALNPDTVQNVFGPNRSTLSSGNNVLAPSMSRFLTGTQASSFNTQIGRSLTSAGPFGSLMSRGGSSAVSSLAKGLGGSVGKVVGALVGAANYVMFPGAGGEGASNYAGVPYTLSDVTFSLQPANKGPQSSGIASASSAPTTGTSLPSSQFTSMPTSAGSPTANALKTSAMRGGLSLNTRAPRLSSGVA